jgi:alkylation response protein AidB-like acyl-CoA dehydrogenase
MDLEFNSDQRGLVDALQHLVERHVAAPREGNVSAAVHSHYSEALDRDLTDAGYFGIAREEGFGPFEAALLIEEVTRSPSVVEVGASALVAPQLTEDALPRPVALMRAAEIGRSVRFLDRARTALVDMGDDVAIIEVKQGDTEPVKAIYAYPFGQFRKPDQTRADLAKARKLKGLGPKMRLWWRVALAVEAGAAMNQAVQFTLEYIKNRRQFGRPIGSFQAVQHRMAMSLQLAEATRWLARRAAWSGSEADAAVAALYAQESIAPLGYDVHQFNGALGMTLEHPLHFWTFRLRALQGELGGQSGHARAVASAVWKAKAA